ncbi:Rid family hydrolase [Leucobacter coleopterorum]|uniref:Rid family hydrolase n=1 Tax=Leucobacter coleopterorum TaxID=2714933 RepID=UPI00244E316C|nr:Rid family hydrolase [Leucobacter coleopterorum]
MRNPPGTFEEQVDTAFARLHGILDNLGASSRDLLRLNLYATKLPSRDLSTLRRIRDRWVDAEHLPASTLIGVEALALPGLEFEVDAVCVDLGWQP